MIQQLRTWGAALTGLMGLLGPVAGRAQQAATPPVISKFGKPELAEFAAKNFVGDSAAPAVVLSDVGTARFTLNGLSFQMETERTTRIKILKKAGYEYATVEIPLYHHDSDEEKITSLKGFTYNAVDGKVEKVKLESTNIFTEERNKNTRVRKFTLPGVREGAIIEYSYAVTSDFFFNFQPWTFQRDIPTRWSEFRATIPEYFTYKMLMQGYEPLALQTQQEASMQFMATERVQRADGVTMSGNVTSHEANATQAITARATQYHWAMQNVPALREEPFMTTSRDYVARLDFELAGERMPGGVYHNRSGGWQKINSELMAHEEFGLLLDRAGFLKEAVHVLAIQHPDPAARAAAVRALVQQNVKYDGTNRLLASGSLKHTWEQHRGTSADVNLLLIAALRQAGLPAQPVLLSTRTHGRINESFPLLEQYNYVVGLLPLADSTELLLDATEPLLPCGMLPARCLSQRGRLVGAKEQYGRWVSLAPKQQHNHFQNIRLTVDAQGNLTGEVHEEHAGYAGAAAREELQQLGEKKYVGQLTTRHPGWEVPSYKFEEVSTVAKPLALTYALRQPASTPGTAQELYVSPLALFGEGRNPFSHAVRTYPVDFGAPTQDVIMLTLTLPAGYTAELPKQAVVDLPDHGGRYVYSASSPTPGTVQLVSRLNLSKAVYGADEYAHLREFYRLALAKQAEALVLKKI